MTSTVEPDWTDAACREYEPELWFPEAGPGKSNDWRTPKQICSGCGIRDACLEYAITNDIRFGVWGGVAERARTELIRNARRTA